LYFRRDNHLSGSIPFDLGGMAMPKLEEFSAVMTRLRGKITRGISFQECEDLPPSACDMPALEKAWPGLSENGHFVKSGRGLISTSNRQSGSVADSESGAGDAFGQKEGKFRTIGDVAYT
jgi:hypothetical protein